MIVNIEQSKPAVNHRVTHRSSVDRPSRHTSKQPRPSIASHIKKKEGSEAKTCVSDLAPLLIGTTARNEMKVKRGEGGGHAQSNVPTSLDVL